MGQSPPATGNNKHIQTVYRETRERELKSNQRLERKKSKLGARKRQDRKQILKRRRNKITGRLATTKWIDAGLV